MTKYPVFLWKYIDSSHSDDNIDPDYNIIYSLVFRRSRTDG